MSKLHDLNRMGQSPWLNYMRRSFIESGELRQRMNDGIRGITANATIFQRALMASDDYDQILQQQLASGMPTRRIHEALMVDDVQRTADMLHPIFESSEGLDGFASLELDPALAQDTVSTVATARHVTALLDRGNVMVEIPSTAAGIAAIEALTGDGVCVNATHIFDIETYERIAQAYINGLEAYFDSHSVWRITPTAVASFSLSPIDNAVDIALLEYGHPELLGKTAVAMAQVLYGRFQDIFSGSRWEKLARHGARVLRPKWTRTTPHNFSYPSTFYVDELIGPDTVTTFSPSTLNAFLDHGTVTFTLSSGQEAAQAHLSELARMGLDLNAITARLQKQHLIASDQRFQALTSSVSRRRDALEAGWKRMTVQLGPFQTATDKTRDELKKTQVMRRLWAHDQSLWPPELTPSGDRLGWLHIIDMMSNNAGRLQAFVQGVLSEGFTNALLIGPQSTCLTAKLFHNTFGKPAQQPILPFPYLALAVADIADLDPAYSLSAQYDMANTLFIVDAQSGCEDAALAGFEHFYWQAADVFGAQQAGKRFVAITAPDCPLATMANQYGFRERLFTDPFINGRFAALSYSGLLPAALVGVDVQELLERAAGMAANSESCCTGRHSLSNQAAQLGAIIGSMALAGCNKLTLVNSLALDSLSAWVAHLLTTGLDQSGNGLVTIFDESLTTPDDYRKDRLFIHLRLAGDTTQDTAVAALAAAGHPVVTLKLEDLYDIGGQFFMWQMATAVAGHILHINPFSQHSIGMTKAYAMV